MPASLPCQRELQPEHAHCTSTCRKWCLWHFCHTQYHPPSKQAHIGNGVNPPFLGCPLSDGWRRKKKKEERGVTNTQRAREGVPISMPPSTIQAGMAKNAFVAGRPTSILSLLSRDAAPNWEGRIGVIELVHAGDYYKDSYSQKRLKSCKSSHVPKALPLTNNLCHPIL